jgi:HD-GYP domain-containing protein (c-di-GMP phosphodiesterase class II)
MRRDSVKQTSYCESSVHEAIEKIKSLLHLNKAHYENALEVSEKVNQYSSNGNQDEQLQLEILKSSYLDTVKMLVNFLDKKDEYTKGHCERVTKFTVAIGQALNLSDLDILNLEFAALLHDIGKLAVPDEIINKEGKLTMQEYEIVKMHPAVGYELIKDIPFLDVSKKILLQHHERVDGKGYPLGLKDDQIDIKAKILSIADAYDAMTSSRPYRKDGLPKEQAISQLKLCTGSQFDKNIVDIFIELLKSGEAA